MVCNFSHEILMNSVLVADYQKSSVRQVTENSVEVIALC